MQGNAMCRVIWPSVVVAGMSLMTGGAAAVAQVAQAPCIPEVAVAQTGSDETSSTLYVACGGKAVMLGSSDRYEASFNADAGALVVARWNGDVASIQFIFVGPDDTLHIDDVSRETAQQLGRSEALQLAQVSVALDSFPEEGAIEVAPLPVAPARGSSKATTNTTITAEPVTINLAAYRNAALDELKRRAISTSSTER